MPKSQLQLLRKKKGIYTYLITKSEKKIVYERALNLYNK